MSRLGIRQIGLRMRPSRCPSKILKTSPEVSFFLALTVCILSPEKTA